MAKRRSTRFSFPRFGCFGGHARAEKMAEDGCPVKLHMYDPSKGLARQLSATTRGKPIEAICMSTPAVAVAPTSSSDIKPRSTDANKTEPDKIVCHGNGSTVPLPTPVLAAPAPTEAPVPLIQGQETSLHGGAVPQQSQFVPNPTESRAPTSSSDTEPISVATGEPEAHKTVGDDNGNAAVPPTVQLAAVRPAAAPVSVAKPVAPAAQDPLAEAKSRAQEEVKREFAAIMATGTARAGEAAALAMRRVMERHGLRQAVTAV